MRRVLYATVALVLAAGPAMACDWHNKSMASASSSGEAVVMTPIPETPAVPVDVATAQTPVSTAN